MTGVAEQVRGLASAAAVEEPRVEVVASSHRLARVEPGRGGIRLILHQELLAAPPAALRGVLAHEIAHIARHDPATRRRLKLASMIAVAVIAVAGIYVSTLLAETGQPLLWAVGLVAELAALFLPRTIQLALLRRQEYETDRLAADLLGGPDEVVAFLDWMTAHTRPVPRPAPVRWWNATHPSNVARRRAMLEVYSNRR